MADDRTDPQYKVRMPAELHARLKAEAEANKRSMNAEIVARLEESLQFGNQKDFEEDIEKHMLINRYMSEAHRFDTVSHQLGDIHKTIKELIDAMNSRGIEIPKLPE